MTPSEASADVSAFLALGSNLGDPLDTMRSARSRLAEIAEIVGASSLYRTEPVGGPTGQPSYLNAVVVVRLPPELGEPVALLDACLALEREHGRERRERWSARTLDIDVLDVGGRIFRHPRVRLPHPRMMERPFVLTPLCEVAPHWRHPVTGEAACARLVELGRTGVERTGLAWDPR